MKKCGFCKKEIKPYAKYDLTEPIEDWLAPKEDRVIQHKKKSWLNPMNTRRVNFEYIEAKKLFRTAQDTKSRDDWIAAFEQYAHYYADVYAYDIDGLSEFGEICTHLAQTAKDRTPTSLYDRALEFYNLSNEKKINNPFRREYESIVIFATELKNLFNLPDLLHPREIYRFPFYIVMKKLSLLIRCPDFYRPPLLKMKEELLVNFSDAGYDPKETKDLLQPMFTG